MCLLHAVLAVITLGIGNVSLQGSMFQTSIRFEVWVDGVFRDASGLSESELQSSRSYRLVPYFERAGGLPVTALTALFFGLTAFFHLGNGALWSDFYIRELTRCRTPLRWLEYAITAPLMYVLIVYGLGVRDWNTLVLGGTLISITMPFGYWVELLARPLAPDRWSRPLRRRLYPYALGHAPQASAWLVVIVGFYDSFGYDPDKIPAFVHAILWSEVVLFFSFGLASLVAQAGRPSQFYRGEILFQLLSLVSKAVLGLLLLVYVLRLDDVQEVYER
jgi:hypothetical protein